MGVDEGRISRRRGAAAVAPPLHPYFSDPPPATNFSGIPQLLDHQQALLASSTSSFTHKPPPPPPPPHPVSVSNPDSFPPLPRAPKPSTPSTTPLPIPSSSNLHPRRVPSSGHQPSAPPPHQRSYAQATNLVRAEMCGGASGGEGRQRRRPATAARSGADLRPLGAGLKCLAEQRGMAEGGDGGCRGRGGEGRRRGVAARGGSGDGRRQRRDDEQTRGSPKGWGLKILGGSVRGGNEWDFLGVYVFE